MPRFRITGSKSTLIQGKRDDAPRVFGSGEMTRELLHCHNRLREKLEFTAQLDEAAAHGANPFAVVATEVGDGLEVWRQPACEPHRLEVALALTLQPPTRLHAVEVAVDADLEQHRRVVRRALDWHGLHPPEPHLEEIQLVDERIDDAHGILLGDELVQRLGQQRDLVPILTFYEP